MVHSTSQSEADPLEAGLVALGDARWMEAKTLLDRAIQSEESAEAQEGLSWAAWWLDDSESLFTARERAFHLYRASSDCAAAARMAIWLAIDQLDFNAAPATSNAWLQRARRLLEPLQPCREHGWLAFQEGYTARVRGDAGKAERRGAAAAALGRQLSVADLEMLGLALQGATLVGSARVDEGMRLLDEATLLAVEDEAEVPIAGAWTCCFLVTACIAARDFGRASEWCDRIGAFAERYGSRYLLAFCRAEYGEVHLWHGRWAEAEDLLESSITDFTRSRPPMASAPLAALAELRRRQDRPKEAAELLDRAGSSTRTRLCRARLALDHGDPLETEDRTQDILRQVAAERRLERAPALEVLARAQAARGEPGQAADALRQLRELGRCAGTEPLRCSGEHAHGVIARAGGDLDASRAALMAAAEGFDACSAPFEAAEARVELAESLLAMGREDAARSEAGAALAGFEQLGAALGSRRARRLLDRADHGQEKMASLTPREREVLTLVAKGLSNREIAGILTLSEHTVHRHVTNILRKLELSSRTAAAAEAAQAGLLPGRRN